MIEQDLERMLFVVSLDRLLRRIISAYEIKRRIIINPNYNPLTSPFLLPAPLNPLFFPISNNHLVFLALLTSFFISQNFSLFTSLSSFAHTSSKSSSTSHASSRSHNKGQATKTKFVGRKVNSRNIFSST